MTTHQSSTRGAERWRPKPEDVEAIVTGQHGNPFAVLGPHGGLGGRVKICVFAPEAEQVEAIDAESCEALSRLLRIDDRGFFCGEAGYLLRPYRLRLRHGAHSWDIWDAYSFPSQLGELDQHLFAEGRHDRIYEKLGAHQTKVYDVEGVMFATWAPNARRVSVVGPFNSWDGRRHPMRRHPGSGIWDLFLPGIDAGEFYKYELIGADGQCIHKADPYGEAHELPPATASRVAGVSARSFVWDDADWMARRGDTQSRAQPISIYEVHLGSWRRGEDGALLSYDRIAHDLIAYVQDLGFTHIELLPITEYPFGGSWGYQPVGLFAPTARYGPPEAFARFVDCMHRAGIGVLLDWVPAHFPNDPHGLIRFDGTALYEHEDPRLGFHKDWNTLIYNYGRREVANYLVANSMFWLERYHADGLRVDAVASMLYLDYSREPGEWVPNKFNGRENLEAIEFLRDMNAHVYGRHPSAMTIAEESTAWPQVSRPVHTGGLGFGYKWNMGWMHDTLQYFALDPVHRRFNHDKLTFGLIYAFNENFILPVSHDEVVHGKRSLLGKMPGDRWQKFANVRAYLAFMWMHPGKKLLFMGSEFAQEREWSHDQSLDWDLLASAEHRGVQSLVRDLNALYRGEGALHQFDCEAAGFSWIDAGNAEESVLAFLRKGEGEARPVLVACNFTPVVRHAYRVGVPCGGVWSERLNTDATHYGGSGVGNSGAAFAEAAPTGGHAFSLTLTLPPLAVIVLVPR
ncbi:MAG: 1,4-alpha-glucan branching protein GlgB [Hyphomicrobium sp.]|jgi:1,4-alpha-glucan branching enzyme